MEYGTQWQTQHQTNTPYEDSLQLTCGTCTCTQPTATAIGHRTKTNLTLGTEYLTRSGQKLSALSDSTVTKTDGNEQTYAVLRAAKERGPKSDHLTLALVATEPTVSR